MPSGKNYEKSDFSQAIIVRAKALNIGGNRESKLDNILNKQRISKNWEEMNFLGKQERWQDFLSLLDEQGRIQPISASSVGMAIIGLIKFISSDQKFRILLLIFIWKLQVRIYILIFCKEMGGAVTALEAVMATGMLAQSIAQAVIKAQIKDLLQKYQGQIQLMKELQQFVDKIMTQQNLVSQLTVSTTFATDNWNTIMDDLRQKNDLLKEIIDSLPKVKPSNYKYTVANGLTFSLSVVALGFVAFNGISGNKNVNVFKDRSGFRKFYEAASNKIRSLAPQFKGSKVNPISGKIEKSSYGTNPKNIPSKNKTSETNNLKNQEKTGLKSKVLMGIRAAFIILSIYGFVKGTLSLISLQSDYNKYKEYFKEKGDFQKAAEGLLQLMEYVASDIYNLANCSRAAFVDCRNIFLVKSIVQMKYYETVWGYSKKLNPDALGLTQSFVNDSEDLIDACNQTMSSGKERKQRLEEFKQNFKKFFDKNKPQTVFLEVAKELGKVVGQYSLISSTVDKEERNVNRFLFRVQQTIEDNRGKGFDEKSDLAKHKTDSKILDDVFQNYRDLIDKNAEEFQENDNIKKMLFQVLTSFVDNFYFDDPTGKTLFGMRIEDAKEKSGSYRQILEAESSKANIIPLRKEDKLEEQKEIQSWINLVKEENKRQGYANWSEEKALIPLHRFIRLEPEDFKTPKGDVISTLGSYEGILFKVQDSLFKLEKHVVKGTLKIQKAS